MCVFDEPRELEEVSNKELGTKNKLLGRKELIYYKGYKAKRLII